MEPSRRGFLVGLSAALAASTVTLPLSAAPVRVLPRISLLATPPWPMTFAGLGRCLEDLFRQVKDMAPDGLTKNEMEAVVINIEEEIKLVCPMGIKFEIETTSERIIAGEWEVEDLMHKGRPGVVVIR